MKSVLLYSGGLDSFILWNLYKPHAMYFDLGGRYSNIEKGLIKKVNKDIAKENPIQIKKLDFYRGNFEEEGGYIPYRNLILLLKMSLFDYDEIYFGMVAEWQRDKSKKFIALTEYIIQDLGKKTIRITTPFYGVSKSNITKQYLQAGYPVDWLYTYSRSCVADTTRECGTCINCLSKYIALVNNNIYRKGHFLTEPRVDIFLKNRQEKFFTDFRWERLPSTITRIIEAYEAKYKEYLRN